MHKNVNVAIIGGGCVGLSVAYHLGKLGVEDVLLLERDYLGAGATCRCGGGMRQQWSTRGNVVLAKHAVQAFANFENELGQDIDFVQGGYLLPAYDQQMLDEFEENIHIQNQAGIDTRLVTPAEVNKIVPLLNTDGMLGASFGPGDGKANPFLVVEGYANRAREMGVEIKTHQAVVGLRSCDEGIEVLTESGKIFARTVVNAAGGFAAEVAAMVGVEIPVRPYRHQVFVTEPVESCFDPMVIDLRRNIYFSQAKHGAFITGQTDHGELSSHNISERWQSGVQIARKLISMVPRLKKVGMLRQWAGSYAVTPDSQPILGPAASEPNMLLACGFSGHGFMLSPIAGKLIAEHIACGHCETLPIDDYLMTRFETQGSICAEQNVV